ncbi:Leukotoxin export ATP-binding protein LtxB [invertebrate metagenome]|uniref:Leukotoxin export ATP-binding protein LtxB n=1 Tax=invertebrate metagenome TaxID=1711999 RepID=A0A2H9T9P3_9ZZZZ
MRLVYNRIIPSYSIDTLWVLSSSVCLIILFEVIVRYIRHKALNLSARKSDIILSSKIMTKIMTIQLENAPISVGAFSRQLQDFDSIRECMTSATITAAIDLPFSLLFLFVIYCLSGFMVIIPIGCMLILIIYCLLIQPAIKRQVEKNARLNIQKHAELIENISGLDSIKLATAENFFQFRWDQLISMVSESEINIRELSSSAQTLSYGLQHLTTIFLTVSGVFCIYNGSLSLGGMIAVMMLGGRSISPIVQLSILSTRYHQAKSALQQINKIMHMPEEQQSTTAFIPHPEITGHFRCNDLSFSYPGNPKKVLSGISVTIEPGDRIIISGKSGSGKTTLSRLLCGLYQPTEGTLLINGITSQQFPASLIRQSIGCLPQTVRVFHGSIRDNIILGNTHYSDKEILRAATMSGVMRFITEEQNGFNRLCGEDGKMLSIGQKQCIALARVFLRAPPILLLDEPLSGMDNSMTEQTLQSLEEISRQVTLIICTAYPGKIYFADRIITLDHGHIIADGTPNHILQSSIQ